MTGFYEWQGAKRPRQPHHIRLAGQAIFTVAAIAQRGSDTTPSSVALVTTPACQGMASIHDHMPLVVPTDLRDAWLGALEPLAVLDALVAYNRGLQVNTHPVGPYVNSTAHDDARCLAPIALPPKLFPD